MSELSAFLHLYFYQVENLIKLQSSGLDAVSFHSDEANTDEALKSFFKEFILSNNSLLGDYAFDLCVNNRGSNVNYEFEQLVTYKIKNVFLSHELISEHKEIIQNQKQSVYTNPDLFLLISNTVTSEDYYVSVELKSTKNDKIPGSSVQQVEPYEWVIFIQHRNGKFNIVTGQYINSITNRLPFPDRSPRPEIGFNTIVQWNKSNRVIRDNVLIFDYSKDDIEAKLSILTSWHDYLVREWLNVVKMESASKKEKWFNHTIRLFSLELLEYYNTLAEQDKDRLLNSLKDITKQH